MFRLDLAAVLTFTASHVFFRRIELKHVALPVESDLLMSTVSVRPSVPPYKPMGTPVAIKFGQLDTQVVIFEYK